MKKYDPLYNFLSQKKENSVTLTFEEVEKIIGDKLPASAFKYVAWWGNSTTKEHPHSRAWLDAGYKTVDVYENIGKQIVKFERE